MTEKLFLLRLSLCKIKFGGKIHENKVCRICKLKYFFF